MAELPEDSNKLTGAPAVVKSPHDRLKRKYGESFPDLRLSPNGAMWRKWIESERKKQEPIMRDKRLHWARHRHFRQGHQWISTRDGRLWREPQSDVNDLRPTLNLIGPALDFRLGILAEQKPGFRQEALGSGVNSREAAEAQQAVAEYYFFYLKAWNMFVDAWYHAQTDGVSFIQMFIDKDKGPQREDIELVPPTDERYGGLMAQGYEVLPSGLLALPYADSGIIAPPGAPARMLNEGELSHRLILAHEVLFSPEARTINGPGEPQAKWASIRRMKDVSEARIETGNDKIESESLITSQSDVLDMPIDRSMGWQRGLPPFPSRRQRLIQGVPEYLLYLRPDPQEEELVNGKWMRIVGNEIVENDGGEGLPGGVIPLARFSDGSMDTDVFPRPVMSDWIPDQISINASLATLMKANRFFSGGRVLTRKGSILEETYSNIVGSLVEYTGEKPEFFAPSGTGNSEAWKQIEFQIKKLEDKTGWNDIARGQISQTGSAQDVSGRAVLAAQQLFERTFGPPVRAAAEGATEWAQLVVTYAKALYKDSPRMIPMAQGRGDLAKEISSEDLGEKPLVYSDPETLMPMPRALRQQLLEDKLDKGRITLSTYQKRSLYADIRDLPMGEMDQWQRAQWVNTLLEEKYEELSQIKEQEEMEYHSSIPPEAQGMQPPFTSMQIYAPNMTPIFWQDDSNTHKQALMEIIMNERKPWKLRELAIERWGIYDQLMRCQLDVSGMTQHPPQVTGIPTDKALNITPPDVSAQMLSMPPQMGGVPSRGAGTMAPQVPMTSPAPTNSSIVTEGQKTSAPKLGQFGNIERTSKAVENQQG